MICYLNKNLVLNLKLLGKKNYFPFILLGKRISSFFLPENIVSMKRDIQFTNEFKMYYSKIFNSLNNSLNIIGFYMNKKPEKIPVFLGENIILTNYNNWYKCFYAQISENKIDFKKIKILSGD